MTLRQFEMVGEILGPSYKNKVGYDAALKLNQLIFGSICARRWIEWNVSGEFFYLTEDCKKLYYLLREWNCYRSTNLTDLGIRATSTYQRGVRRSRLHRVA